MTFESSMDTDTYSYDILRQIVCSLLLVETLVMIEINK